MRIGTWPRVSPSTFGTEIREKSLFVLLPLTLLGMDTSLKRFQSRHEEKTKNPTYEGD